MEKIAVIYGPEGGYTDEVAHMLAREWGENETVLLPVSRVNEKDLATFDHLIFGGPTIGAHNWSHDKGNNDWDVFLTRLHKMDLHGKTCAIFGLGDQVSYGRHFVDDMGVLAEHLKTSGAKLIGQTSPDDYHFEESKALVDGVFVGLPLDHDNEPEKTLPRLKTWVSLLKKDV